jgi:hypothetical protein
VDQVPALESFLREAAVAADVDDEPIPVKPCWYVSILTFRQSCPLALSVLFPPSLKYPSYFSISPRPNEPCFPQNLPGRNSNTSLTIPSAAGEPALVTVIAINPRKFWLHSWSGGLVLQPLPVGFRHLALLLPSLYSCRRQWRFFKPGLQRLVLRFCAIVCFELSG